MSKVEVYYPNQEGVSEVCLRIRDESATLEDLLQAWQPLCDDSSLFKSFAPGNHAPCKGCTVNCCQSAYVIPDLIAFKRMAEGLHLSHRDFLSAYFQADKLAVGLPRMKPNPCIFLQNNICSIYPWRSLICRFYICTPLKGATEQLVYSLTWTGITATIVKLEEAGLLQPDPGAGMSSMDMLFNDLIVEYRDKPGVRLFMEADTYRDIALLPFLDSYTSELWQPCP